MLKVIMLLNSTFVEHRDFECNIFTFSIVNDRSHCDLRSNKIFQDDGLAATCLATAIPSDRLLLSADKLFPGRETLWRLHRQKNGVRGRRIGKGELTA